jgi:signal transduction histidine kinase
VADNGVGMDEVIRETAFEPFVTTRRGAGGTGLGLNIVFNIVQRLNGVISLESSARGTSIFIQIPGIIREANEEDDSGKPQEFSE